MTRQRLHKLRQILTDKNAAGIFVTNAKNIFYLTGFIGISPEERESSLLVTPRDAFLFIPEMYAERARVCAELAKNEYQLIVDHERHGLLTRFSSFFAGHETILCEGDDLTVNELTKIKNISELNFLPMSGLVESLRLIKDESEIASLRIGANITDQVFSAIVSVLQQTDYTTLRENDIIDMMRSFGREFGADKFGFDPIVAVGHGSAEPHYVSMNRKLEKEKTLLLDFGFTYAGYTSDVSRTIFLGEPTKQFQKIYTWVKECNELCIAACRPGVSTQELYGLSHTFFKERNVEKQYLHSLGHGVGLDVHEAPSLGSVGKTELQPGMVITIEPGLYFTGEFGVRIEDDILITESGHEVLSKSTKELTTI